MLPTPRVFRAEEGCWCMLCGCEQEGAAGDGHARDGDRAWELSLGKQ